MSYPTVSFSVIIPSKNADNLRPCIEAIWGQEEDENRIIAVDDGIDMPEHQWGDILRVPGEKPFIFARNVNLGIRAAGNDDVFLVNDDALLQTPNGLSKIAELAVDHPEFGLISASCNNVGNTRQYQRVCPCCHRPEDTLREDPRMVCFVCVFIPRSTIEKVGLLDERFVGYGFDDDDYCLRVRRAGLKIGIYDGCYVDHGSLKSSFRGGAKAQIDLNQNRKIFEEKWGKYPA